MELENVGVHSVEEVKEPVYEKWELKYLEYVNLKEDGMKAAVHAAPKAVRGTDASQKQREIAWNHRRTAALQHLAGNLPSHRILLHPFASFFLRAPPVQRLSLSVKSSEIFYSNKKRPSKNKG